MVFNQQTYKKSMTYDGGNPGPGWDRNRNVVKFNPVNEM
jgi:hypothetical protein